MSVSPTTGETLVSTMRDMMRFTITTGVGMIVDGGEVTIRTSCLCWAGGGTGILATGIQPGAMTRTPRIRMTDRFTPGMRM